MKLYVARHGEATWNAEKRILGSAPGDLTAKGLEQAQLLAKNMRPLGLAALVSSDLFRALETARIVQADHENLTLIPKAEWRERNFGNLEGKLRAEVDWDEFWSAPDHESPFGAESLDDFNARIARAVLDLAVTYPDETIAVIAHGGTMNRLNYLTDPERFKVIEYPNAEAIEFNTKNLIRNSKKLLGI